MAGKKVKRASQNEYYDIVEAIKQLAGCGEKFPSMQRLVKTVRDTISHPDAKEEDKPNVSDTTVKKAAEKVGVEINDLVEEKPNSGKGAPHVRMAMEHRDRIQALEGELQALRDEYYVEIDDLKKRSERTEDLVRSLAKEVRREDLIGGKHSGPSPVGYREITPLSGPGSSS